MSGKETTPRDIAVRPAGPTQSERVVFHYGADSLIGTWSPDENQAVVDAYLEMLAAEMAGRSYTKAEYNRAVQRLTNRNRASIEFKFCNISAVLDALGYPYVDGYKPRGNAQKSLWAVVESSASLLGLPQLKRATIRGAADMSQESAEKRNHWQTCARLWERATGGTHVAAQPDQPVDDFWPTAMRPPGVEEGLEWLASEQPAGSLARWLFLIGGPGAGKSHATATARKGMQPVDVTDTGLANRTYRYMGHEADLFVINDATISPDAAQAPLIDDLNGLAFQAAETISKPTNVIGCVNRGILIEELAGVDQKNGIEQPGIGVVRWLNRQDVLKDGPLRWQIDQEIAGSFVRSAVLVYDETPVAHLLVVSVDECSLFERRPLVTIVGDRVATAADYEVAALEDRPEIPEGSMPAADLLLRVLERFDAAQVEEELIADPIGANLINLSTSKLRTSLHTIARSSELATSARMTYREIWGLLVRAFVGNAPNMMAPDELRDHIRRLQPDGSTASADFDQIRRLADFRVHQAIFGGTELTSEQIMSDPVLRMTSMVDPLRDAIPGRAPFDAQRGWATPVAEALTTLLSEESPLNVVMRYDVDGHLAAAVTDFDWRVDEYYVTLLDDEDLTDAARNNATAWYGKYLTRLYAFAFGISAFRAEIATLLQALRQKDHLPDRLQAPMRTLIRPKRHVEAAASESLIPLFDSRTDPIIGRPAIPKLAIRVGDFELKSEREGGEHSMLTIHRDGKLMAKMTLDFALVREAMACAGDSAGVTDLVDVTAPRLERIRASRLLVKQLEGTEVRIVEGGAGYQVTVPWKAQVD